jgi:prepilin-type N-terminal cleavage/methylation domain-containing protein
MVTVRKTDEGFTLTETMVVVVILSLLAAISMPLFTRDNTARKGRDWAKIVAQMLQRAKFQAMADRANIHLMLYRTQIQMYRENIPIPPATTTTFTLLSSTPGPSHDDGKTVAIWDARTDLVVPTGKSSNMDVAPAPPTALVPRGNEITFTSLGSTTGNANWRVYIRNELLPRAHPDAFFLVRVGGLTGFVSSNEMVTAP